MKQFEKNAKAYQRVREKITYPESLYEYLNSNIIKDDSRTYTALDIGCGNGVSTVRLTPYFEKVIGSDLGEMLIDQARLNYSDIEFHCIPSEEIELEDTFDLITSATSFYWMDRETVLKRLVKKCLQVEYSAHINMIFQLFMGH